MPKRTSERQERDPGDDSQAWSVVWKLEEVGQFLFASGNMKYWLVVSREELVGVDGGKIYSEAPVTVRASSHSDQPYQGNHFSPSTSNYDCFSNDVQKRRWGVC